MGWFVSVNHSHTEKVSQSKTSAVIAFISPHRRREGHESGEALRCSSKIHGLPIIDVMLTLAMVGPRGWSSVTLRSGIAIVDPPVTCPLCSCITSPGAIAQNLSPPRRRPCSTLPNRALLASPSLGTLFGEVEGPACNGAGGGLGNARERDRM